MRLKPLACLALALALPITVAAVQVGGGGHGGGGYDINKDLKNLGPAAYDLAIVLAGAEQVTNSFNGYQSGSIVGWFSSRTETTVGGNTVIHWEIFDDGSDDRVDPNQTIHVGFSTADHNRTIVDMYWTDPNGNRIVGSVVYDVFANVTYRGNRIRWDLSNQLSDAAVSVSAVRYAVLPERVALQDLGRDNAALAAALHPVDLDAVLAPGQQLSVEIPEDVAAGSAVVLAYEVSGPGSEAVVTNYVQTVAR